MDERQAVVRSVHGEVRIVNDEQYRDRQWRLHREKWWRMFATTMVLLDGVNSKGEVLMIPTQQAVRAADAAYPGGRPLGDRALDVNIKVRFISSVTLRATAAEFNKAGFKTGYTEKDISVDRL